jgi:DNA-binding CsgD family transcriptional regulator
MQKQTITIDWILETEHDRLRCSDFRKIMLNYIAKLEDSTKVKVVWENHTIDKAVDIYRRDSDHPIDNLSKREREITDLLCNNYSVKRIAERLFISENTVKKHIQNLKRKLNLNEHGMELVFQLKSICS